MKILYITVQSILTLGTRLKTTLHVAAWYWNLQNSTATVHVTSGRQETSCKYLQLNLK